MQNCTASYWSVVFTLWDHMTSCYFETLIGQCRSHDLIQVPLQFSTKVSSPGDFNCVISRLFYDIIVYMV